MRVKLSLLSLLVGCLSLWLAGGAAAQTADGLHLKVYKSPTCGCCTAWMDHLEAAAIDSEGLHPPDMGQLKQALGIPVRYGSCHTAVSPAGYVFEGHVPARYIRQFLDAPPADALGLTVPAMPVGSPGMEYQNRFMPYDVLLLKKDGSVEVFASVRRYEQQFSESALGQ